MRVVVDASAVVAALIDSSDVGAWCAEQLASNDLAAPHLMPFEVANILRRTVLRGALEAGEGTAALHDLDLLTVSLVPFAGLFERLWQLRATLTAYDAGYVATAELLDCPLVTLDRRLAAAPGLTCPVLVAP